MKRCVFKDFNGETWFFEEWSDHQGTHYRLSDVKGMTIAEAIDMSMSFQSWVQDLIKQAMDDSDERTSRDQKRLLAQP